MLGFTFTDRARPIVQIGVGDSRVTSPGGRWGTARWGEYDEWAGNDPVWYDRTCDTVSVDITGGRLRTSDRFDSATATVVVDNTTGWADQAADPDAILSLRPGRTIRVGIDHATLGRVWKFWGVIDELNPKYVAHEPDEAVIVAVDMLADANRAKLTPTGIPLDEEPAGQRVANILAAVPIPAERVRVDATSVTVRADDLDGQVADLVHQAADSGGGATYGAPDGLIYYRARDWQAYDPDLPPDATVGNVDPDDVCPVSFDRPFARADIATRVILRRDDLPESPTSPMQFDDGPAQVRYGIEPFERSDLLTVRDVDLGELGWRWLHVRGEATAPRIRSASFDAATADNVVDLCTTVSPYTPSRYRCRLELDRGVVFDRQHYVTRARHIMTRDRWLVDVTLDIADTYARAGGRWGSARWGGTYDTWAAG